MTQEVIKLGASRIIYSKAGPLGCYPYILTALYTHDPAAYDKLGCLNAVNGLVMSHNHALDVAFDCLKVDFPHVQILGADAYTPIITILNQTTAPGKCCSITTILFIFSHWLQYRKLNHKIIQILRF